jgi:hypothetical protein
LAQNLALAMALALANRQNANIDKNSVDIQNN